MIRRALKLLPLISCVLACYLASGSFAGQERSPARATFPDSVAAALQARTSAIFARSCATAGCHGSAYPKARLPLAPGTFAEALKNAPSRQIESLRLVDTQCPARSYLIMKVRGIKGIKGSRMPIEMPALAREDERAIELWAASLAAFDMPAVPPPLERDGK